MERRYLYLILLTTLMAAVAKSAPARTMPPTKKPAVVKLPPAPPKGKAAFPKQKGRRPAGKIIKIFPSDKHVDPKELAAAPTATQVAEKRRASAVVKPPKSAPKPKRPLAAVKTPRK